MTNRTWTKPLLKEKKLNNKGPEEMYIHPATGNQLSE